MLTNIQLNETPIDDLISARTCLLEQLQSAYYAYNNLRKQAKQSELAHASLAKTYRSLDMELALRTKKTIVIKPKRKPVKSTRDDLLQKVSELSADEKANFMKLILETNNA